MIPLPTPTSIQRQITSTQTQSQTVKATGSGQTEATTAIGELTFKNYDHCKHTLPADFTYVSASGVRVKTDVDTNVPAGGIEFPSSVTVDAHAVNSGAAGNITARDVNFVIPVSCNATYLSRVNVTNDAPFTGGQDGQTYTYVQQNDIDEAATSLINSTQQRAIDDIHQQLQPNEHLVGDPQCTSNVSPDHKVGDRVSQVTVTVTTTCKATAST